MEFTFETAYNQKALTAMARGLRKTVRKKSSKRSHIFGWICIVLAILFIIPMGSETFVLDGKMMVTILATAAILLVFCFEDKLNGYIAKKRMIKDLDKAVCTFGEESYISETNVGKSEFKYDRVQALAETADYFVFVFDFSHAQIYDKKQLKGGTLEEFRKFIEAKTGKEIQVI